MYKVVDDGPWCLGRESKCVSGGKRTVLFPSLTTLTFSLPKHTGPSYKPYCMPSLTVALLLLEWLHDGVYAGQGSLTVYVCYRRARHTYRHQ